MARSGAIERALLIVRQVDARPGSDQSDQGLRRRAVGRAAAAACRGADRQEVRDATQQAPATPQGEVLGLAALTATTLPVAHAAPGTTQRVSVDTAGAQANDASTEPSISGDGSVVVFFSAAANLVAGDTNSCQFPAVSFFGGHCPDIFAHAG